MALSRYACSLYHYRLILSVREIALSFVSEMPHNVFANPADRSLYFRKESCNLVGVHLNKGHVIVLLSLVEGSMQRSGILLWQLARTDEFFVEESNHG